MINKVILFYKYIKITNPEALKSEQKQLCDSLGLKGRILIAHEGINGTVGGLPESVDAYIEVMKAHALFSDVDFKESLAKGDCFPKLKVKVRTTIVNLGIDSEKITATDGGKHLTPHEAHALIEKNAKDFVIFDARNAFEANIGKFENAVVPNIEYFRELPGFIDQNSDLFKDKEVLMYCTGGIRCERASAYLKSKNIAKEVYQLEGGIHRYIEQFPNGYFRGNNYVFDGRVSMPANDDLLSNCVQCNIACNEYVNCVNAQCNKQFIVCDACKNILQECCSQTCRELVYEKKVVIRSTSAKTACAVVAKN